MSVIRSFQGVSYDVATHREEKFEDKVGEYVDSNLFAFWFGKSGARSIRETRCEYFLDDIGRLLDHRLAVLVSGASPPT